MATSKKIRVIGTKQFVDYETGELQEFNVISQEEQDNNFDKFWISQVMFAIEEFGSKKMEILLYLIQKRERANNTVLKTVAEIAEETGINKNTIVTTLKILERHQIIKRKTGIIFISPDVIFRGGHAKRMNILIQYREVEQEVPEQEVTEPKQLTAAPAEAEISVDSSKKKRRKAKSAAAGVTQ